jgi:hypothetical protein
MWGVLPGESDDPAGTFNAEAREVLVRKFLRAGTAFRVDNHAVGQDSRALDDRLAGNLAGDPFNVGAVSPVYLGRVVHDDSSGSGFDDCSTWNRAGGKVSWNYRTGEVHVGSPSNTTDTEPSNNGIVLTPIDVDAGSTVSLEHLDDVAIHTANGEITLEQTKSAPTQNPPIRLGG